MYKKSKQRETIARLLKSTTSHPSAIWIYEQVKKEIPHISLATVYRNLRILKQSGEIKEVCIADDTAFFDGNIRQHYHFRCDRCGKIIDLEEPADTEIETRIARKTGLKVTHHRLELGGLCLECQKRGPWGQNHN
ncbi:MAG: transcriptional repressor [Dehalococcoidales bacterium]|nr:transcriptional repressor [Dehalococcoidales bacterium]